MVQSSNKHLYITTNAGLITDQITGLHHSTQVHRLTNQKHAQTDWLVKQVHV